jgi:hypothetical protein
MVAFGLMHVLSPAFHDFTVSEKHELAVKASSWLRLYDLCFSTLPEAD